jgi:hypothetical protein
MTKALIVGWFSFSDGHATAGDILAADTLCGWLDRIGCPYDIAAASPFEGGIDWMKANPGDYSHVIFVCGPFADIDNTRAFLSRFRQCKLIGLNLSMVKPVDVWNPFDVLIERDSSRRTNPDIVFSANRALVPVVGVCLVEPYGAEFEDEAYAAITRLMATLDVAIVNIDTRLDGNAAGLRTPSEIESLIARMDVVVTTRLHGMVLALKNGVPCISLDPGGGHSKIEKQATKIGWPLVFTSVNTTDAALKSAFDYCLTEEARIAARACGERAKTLVQEIESELLAAVHAVTEGEATPHGSRRAAAPRISVRLDTKIPWQGSEAPSSLTAKVKRLASRVLPVRLYAWLRTRYKTFLGASVP